MSIDNVLSDEEDVLWILKINEIVEDLRKHKSRSAAWLLITQLYEYSCAKCASYDGKTASLELLKDYGKQEDWSVYIDYLYDCSLGIQKALYSTDNSIIKIFQDKMYDDLVRTFFPQALIDKLLDIKLFVHCVL